MRHLLGLSVKAVSPFVALAVGVAVNPSELHAQQTGAVELQRYRPVHPVGRGFELEGTRPLGHLKVAAALDANYASRLLRVTALADGTQTSTDAVESALAADLLLGVGLFRRFDVALALPVMLRQSGRTPPGAAAAGESGAGDIRLTARARLLDPGADGLSLAVSFTGTAALGAKQTYINEAKPTLEPRMVVAYKRRSWQWGARIGLRLREETSLLGTPIGNQATFAGGVDKRFGRATHAIAEIVGATPADGRMFNRRLTPLELLAGARRQWQGVSFGLGVGLGLVSGFGSPAWRALASLSWTNDPPDADRDGIPDTDDHCVDDAEDRDGFKDQDGCPDPDNDLDGVLDPFDQCPFEPEDLDDFEDEDGCPELDNDGDGIADASDKCPNEAETRNDFEDTDGCPDKMPDTDRDGDGIIDGKDSCPDEAEDPDQFEDEDGCPDPDNDKDGILDVDDKCPLAPETINGRQDDDGCPDEGAPQVRVGEKELEVLQPVFFNTNRFRIRRRFWNILNQIALTLKAHPEIGRCAVEGHADATGPEDWNSKLSTLRAQQVVDHLVRKGVDKARLSAMGHGDQKPWADNETPEGRARNRRVVFHIEGVFSSRAPSEGIKVHDANAASTGSARSGSQEASSARTPAATSEVLAPRSALRGPRNSRTSNKTIEAGSVSKTKPAETTRGAAPISPGPGVGAAEPPVVESPPVHPLKAKTLREAVRLPSPSDAPAKP